jgi:hypothetical protein
LFNNGIAQAVKLLAMVLAARIRSPAAVRILHVCASEISWLSKVFEPMKGRAEKA